MRSLIIRSSYGSRFQGFGRFLTGSTAEYYFRTIAPVAYSGRPAPHIHFSRHNYVLEVLDSLGGRKDFEGAFCILRRVRMQGKPS